MSEKTDTDFLLHITEAINRTIKYTDGMNYEEFVQDTKTHDAVIRNIEIIGEAAKNISDDIKISYDEIPWKNMAGMRDRLIHHYFGVNLSIVWTVVKEELPSVNEQIQSIAQEIMKYSS